MASTRIRARTTLRARVAALARGRAAGPEAVHELHRALRRARLEARLRGAEGPTAAVRDLERRLGLWRDRALFRLTLRGAEPAGLRARERSWRRAAYARSLREERAARAQALTSARRAARDRSLDREPPGAAPGALGGALRARRALATAHGRARERLSMRRAHELRKQLRRFGFLRDLRAPSRERGRRPPAVRCLVAALGRLHDLDVALERLASYPRGGRRWRARMARERARIEKRVRRALRSRALGRFVRGL